MGITNTRRPLNEWVICECGEPEFVKIEMNYNVWLVLDIKNVCDYQPQSLGACESKARIDKLEIDILLLKLQMMHDRNVPTKIDEQRLIPLQISVWLEVITQQNEFS